MSEPSEMSPEMSKDAFLALVKDLELPGNEQRLEALYEEVLVTLRRAAVLHETDTSGVEPSSVSPWTDGGET